MSRRLPALLFVLPLATACGFSSGLPGGTEGKDLTPAQNKQFCEAQETYFHEQIAGDEKRIACFSAGLLASLMAEDKVAACQKAFDDCLDKPDEDDGYPPGHGCGERESDPECTATVAEMEACVEEIARAVSDYARGLSCASIDSEVPDELDEEAGEACKLVRSKGC